MEAHLLHKKLRIQVFLLSLFLSSSLVYRNCNIAQIPISVRYIFSKKPWCQHFRIHSFRFLMIQVMHRDGHMIKFPQILFFVLLLSRQYTVTPCYLLHIAAQILPVPF